MQCKHNDPDEPCPLVLKVNSLRDALDFLDLCKKDHLNSKLTGAYKDAWEWIEQAARKVVEQ